MESSLSIVICIYNYTSLSLLSQGAARQFKRQSICIHLSHSDLGRKQLLARKTVIITIWYLDVVLMVMNDAKTNNNNLFPLMTI